MKYTLSMGIDPGLTGAVSVIYDRTIVACYLMPKGLDKKFSVLKFQKNILEDIKSKCDTSRLIVMLEKAQAMPKQGVSSMFSYGQHFGMLEASIQAYGFDYKLIRPSEWHKRIRSHYFYQDDLGAKENAFNAYSHIFASHNPPEVLYPGKRMKKPHQGVIDACLIAYSGLIT